MPQPPPRAVTDELRAMMLRDWGRPVHEGVELVDIDRAAHLYGIVANPYHKLAFGHLSTKEMQLVCIRGLIGQGDFEEASRALLKMQNNERQAASRAARLKPKPKPRVQLHWSAEPDHRSKPDLLAIAFDPEPNPS